MLSDQLCTQLDQCKLTANLLKGHQPRLHTRHHNHNWLSLFCRVSDLKRFFHPQGRPQTLKNRATLPSAVAESGKARYGRESVVIMDNLKASLFQKIKYASVQRKHRTGRAALGFCGFPPSEDN